MHCPSCGFDTPEGTRFCIECGSPLKVGCSSCGSENLPQAKFCGECGTSLTEQLPIMQPHPLIPRSRMPQSYTPKYLTEKILITRSAIEGERRQVTILFADTAGFTTLAEQLDPEEVHEIIEGCFERITTEVHRFEGTINQYTGDGVMALFGAPIAHEDGPRRAAHAALGIQHTLREYSNELQAQRGLTLQLRIGLNTGLVVVGKIGDDLRMDYTAVGDTTNLAARLQQMAQPGSVVISEATHKLVSGFFETLDLGEVPIKGHTPVRAFELLRPRGRRVRFDVAVERGLTPFIGRSRDLGTLLDRFHEVKAGRGQIVFIAGEAGIGKSRLVLEFRRALTQAGEDVTWLEGRCISFGQSIPFLPLIEQLRANFRIEEFDGEQEIITKLDHGIKRIEHLEDHIPSIRYLLSVDPGDPRIAAMGALARRKQLFEALRALALRSARLRPLILVVEDLHWLDSSTEEFLGFLMDSVVAVPLMLVLTYRSGYTPPYGSRSFHTTLTLHSLSEAESLAMAGYVLGRKPFPEELKSALMIKAEGVPLFIEEVTKSLLELGILRWEHGGYQMVKETIEVRVPDTIQEIIMARLDRLSEEGKHTVQVASVIGRQFPARLLERVAGWGAHLREVLRELQALEFIYERELLPESAYIFKHGVIQDVAYNSLLMQRRKELHRVVGKAIEVLYRDRLEEHYGELAHHFSQGEVWERALAYGRQAGAKAMARLAYREAVACFEQALGALRHLPEDRDQLEQAIDLRFDLRQALFPLREFGRMLDYLREAETFAKALGDQRRLGQVYGYMTNYFRMIGEYDHAAASGERALTIAACLGDFQLQVVTNQYLGIVYYVQGDYQQAVRFLRKNVEALGGDQLHERFGLSSLPVVMSRAWLVLVLAQTGDFAEAITIGEEAIQMAEAADHPYSRIAAYFGVGIMYLSQGDLQKAIPVLERGVTLYESTDIRVFPHGPAALSYAYALAGRVTEALRQLEQSTAKMGRSRSQLLHVNEVYLLAGRLEEVIPRARQALELYQECKERGSQAWAHRLLGEIASQHDPPAVEPAETHYRQACAIAKELEMRPLLGHCHLGLGILYGKIGQLELAHAELSAAIELFQAMEMMFWQTRAEAALSKVK
jgi:class 3 adenylate cyclase/tetratricopeptide (TPR) repeat protein